MFVWIPQWKMINISLTSTSKENTVSCNIHNLVVEMGYIFPAMSLCFHSELYPHVPKVFL
jgi:hypothetical protein